MKQIINNQAMEEKNVFKVYWAWQDEQEENWLCEMSKNGWHLKSVSPFVYTFHKGEPGEFVYRLDYKHTLDKDYAEYQAIFKDSGWELIALMSNWHYYRIRPDNVAVPEIYNDNYSKSIKYQRLLGILLPIFCVTMLTVPPGITSSRAYPGGWWDVVIILGLVIKVFFIYAVIRVGAKLIQLRKN